MAAPVAAFSREIVITIEGRHYFLNVLNAGQVQAALLDKGIVTTYEEPDWIRLTVTDYNLANNFLQQVPDIQALSHPSNINIPENTVDVALHRWNDEGHGDAALPFGTNFRILYRGVSNEHARKLASIVIDLVLNIPHLGLTSWYRILALSME
ncbi:uncharacterized protein [Dermacentor andersoni]|uniref:uncharacterized protein n=1 Tax=Dermacentor andersoni TaxID=34620 RepID=UPI002415DEF5|nr:uncharacterized protein LOC126523411 [Dermacentor andersoni]